MATYTVTGHPLNYADLGIAATDAIRNLLQDNGVGQPVTIVLSGPDDAKIKSEGCLA